MKIEEQKIKIAELRGYSITNDGTFFILWNPDGKKLYGSNHRENLAQACPDYLKCLNAIQDTVLFFRDKNMLIYIEYQRILQNILARDNSNKTEGDVCFISEATAAQKSEALLKALNLWRE